MCIKSNPFFSRTFVSAFLIVGALWKTANVWAADALLSSQASIGASVSPAKMVVIKKLSTHSPSAKAGVHVDDIILSINRYKLTAAADVRKAMAEVQANQMVDMEFLEYNKVQRSYEFHQVTVQSTAQGTVGISFDDADSYIINDFPPGSPCEKLGMQKGDILLSLNKDKLQSASDVRTAMLMVQPGQPVEVEFASYKADKKSFEFHEAMVETVARPTQNTPPAPEKLELADLAKHSERWPAVVTLRKDVTLPSGEIVPAGERFRVAAFEDAAQNLSLEDNLRSITIAPQDSDFLQAANAAWAPLTPAQKAIDLATLTQDDSLWPLQVTVSRLLKISTGVNVNAGEKLNLVSFQPSGRLWLELDGTHTVGANIDETDIMAQARQRVLLAPEARPSRIAEALRGLLVDANGQPYKNAQMDDSRIFVLYFGASWCGPCREFSPSFSQYVKRVAPNNPRLGVIFMDFDEEPGKMLAYMKETQMPWPAVPLASIKKNVVLSQFFRNALPQLVILDRNGTILTDSHNRDIYDSGWTLSRLVDAGAAR